MNNIIRPEYIQLYLRYRVLSVICSTVAYLLGLIYGNYRWYFAIFISVGMITACAIGTFLYKKIIFEEKSRLWFLLTLILEQVAYGVFIAMSGGMSSPYLWCFLGYIFLVVIATDRYHLLLVLSIVWIVFCVTVGSRIFNPMQGFDRSDINTIIGIVIVFVSFYTLRKYIVQLEERRRESELLSKRLQKEKETTQEALHQITHLYDTVNILTITNRKQSMEELAKLLASSIVSKGCMLLKFKMGKQQEIDEISSYGLEEHILQEILKNINNMELGIRDRIFMAGDCLFEARVIGSGVFISGLLVFASEEEYGRSINTNDDILSFYQNIIESVFKDMDMQKSLEHGIIKEEQHRIASEIHDTVIQKLFGISCSLKALENTIDKMPREELADCLQSIEKSTRLAMKELRETIYGIRFESESGEAFEDKLKLYLQEAQRLSAVSINLDITGELSLLSLAQKTVVYRIICESVNNAIRHGSTSNIHVKLMINEKGIFTCIRDDGSGFDLAMVRIEGTGIKNIHFMTSLMKGKCSVYSEEGKGTKVDIFLPW